MFILFGDLCCTEDDHCIISLFHFTNWQSCRQFKFLNDLGTTHYTHDSETMDLWSSGFLPNILNTEHLWGYLKPIIKQLWFRKSRLLGMRVFKLLIFIIFFNPSTLTKQRMEVTMYVCFPVRPYSFRWIFKNGCIQVLTELYGIEFLHFHCPELSSFLF